MLKFKKNDKVIITAGKDKGNSGKIDRVVPEKEAVVIPGMNLYKRHVKKRDAQNPGGMVDIARPLSFGKVALVCPKCKKPTRVSFETVKSGKVRVCRKCKKAID